MKDNQAIKGFVLVVDDDPEIRAVLTTILKNAGYTCDEAWDSPSAIEKIQEKRYDIVFIDLLMPGPPSQEAIKQIKNISPETAVAVISIVGDEASMKELFDTGASVYIRKPFNIEEIVSIAESLIIGDKIHHNTLKH